MCCHHRKPREADIFMLFPWFSVEAELTIFNVTLFVKIIFEKELMKTKKIAINGKS